MILSNCPKTLKLLIPLFVIGCGTIAFYSYNTAATMDGQRITKSQISSMVKAQATLQNVSDITQLSNLRQSALQGLINQTLLAQEAKRQKVEVKESDLKVKMAENNQAWSQGGNTRLSLEAQGYTYWNRKDLVQTQLLIQGLTANLGNPTGPELKDFATTNKAAYSEYSIRYAVTSNQEEANQLIQTDLAILPIVKMYGKQLPDPVLKAISGLKQESKAIAVSFENKVWIVKVLSIRNGKDETQQDLKVQMQSQKTQELLTALRPKSHILIKN